MPKLFELRKSHPETFKRIDDSMNSLGVFLSQELVRFNGLIEVMVHSLKELRRAIKGEVVMSASLERMYNCFVFQTVPKSWEEAGYPCLKPLASWVEDFLRRIEFMGSWLTGGPRPLYWLPGFFFPQGFMTAVKQTYSRDNKIAVDTLKIGCVMTNMEVNAITKAPTFGAYVYGLFMEGGRFDRHTMVMAESIPRLLFDSLPTIWLKPVIATDYNPPNVYECPLYKTSLRAGTLSTTGHSTNFVVALPVPTTDTVDHWVRSGCAMLCMLDD
jgi:dynein heavy chain